MKNHNIYYQSRDELEAFIIKSDIIDSDKLLIQVFTSKSDPTYIGTIINDISLYLPKAHIIGATTDGEIMDGSVSEGETVLSFTLFDKTDIEIVSIKHTDRGFKSGEKLAKLLIKDDTKAIITFATCYNTSGEEYLKGISCVDENVIVSGGIASHNSLSTDTYVFTKDSILDNGVVGVALRSKELQVHNDYSYNWSRIGLELSIEDVKQNRVYKIDGRTAYDTYVHYLGDDIAKTLPSSGTEFPLIINRDGFLVSRAVVDVHNDGSLSFAGDFSVGDIVQFGYGDIKRIYAKSIDTRKKIIEKPVEVIYIYSCMARRHYLNKDIENEIAPLQTIAPISGFFTHGEFYTNKNREFLNQTMTLLVLSEDKKVKDKSLVSDISKSFNHQSTSINALANLINVVSDEVNAQKKELLRQKNLFENLFEKSSDGSLILKDGYFVKCNERAYTSLGYKSKDDLIGKRPLDISPEYQPDGESSISKSKKMIDLSIKKGIHQFEWIHLMADGTPCWFEVRLAPLKIEGEDYVYATWRDIQHKKEMLERLESQQKELYFQANHDTLTGLANRNLFYDRLKQAILKAKRSEKKVALFFIDLDMFKDVNDFFGHDIGDVLLKNVTKRLKKHTREEDTISRIGGDEFTVIMEQISDIEVVSKKADIILSEVLKPYHIQNHTINISCSIGVSIYPDDTQNIHDLIKYADTAMYKAKTEGRNRQWFYSNEMTEIVAKRLEIDNDIRVAIIEDQFEAYYQPIIDAKYEKIIGAEALIRWNHPKKGMIFPDEFIPVAEKSDLIIKIDDWMMDKTMKEFAKFYKNGLNPGQLSLNLSISQLEDINYISKLKDCMKKHSFDPKWLKLEILERQVMKKAQDNIIKLNEIRSLGITLAMDDFGTGESSFTYLRKFPISQIKIDKSFVISMQEDNENKEIVKAIVALGNSLKLDVIAEGVESEDDKNFLIENGCSMMQGYHFFKPLSVDNFSKLLDNDL